MKRACIDLGSNMAQMLIIDDKSKEHNYCEVTALGDSTYKTKLLKDSAIFRTLEVLQLFKKTLITFNINPSDVIIYGTEACRIATNIQSLFDPIKKLGFSFQIIEAKLEAMFCAKGALQYFNNEREYVVLDIGGASTEFCQLNDDKNLIRNFASLQIGTLSFSDWAHENVLYEKIKIFKQEHLKTLKFAIQKDIVCARGAMTTIFNMLDNNESKIENEYHEKSIDVGLISEKLEQFTRHSLIDLLEKYPYISERKNTLFGAFHLAKYLLEIIMPKKIYVSSRGLVHGALLKN